MLRGSARTSLGRARTSLRRTSLRRTLLGCKCYWAARAGWCACPWGLGCALLGCALLGRMLLLLGHLPLAGSGVNPEAMSRIVFCVHHGTHKTPSFFSRWKERNGTLAFLFQVERTEQKAAIFPGIHSTEEYLFFVSLCRRCIGSLAFGLLQLADMGANLTMIRASAVRFPPPATTFREDTNHFAHSNTQTR